MYLCMGVSVCLCVYVSGWLGSWVEGGVSVHTLLSVSMHSLWPRIPSCAGTLQIACLSL